MSDKGKGKQPSTDSAKNPNVQIGYMHYPVIQSYYQELTKSSLENVVDAMWANILPLYFPLSQGYGIEQQMRPTPSVSKQSADIAIRYVRNGQPKKICLIEDKRVMFEGSSSKWAEAVDQLTEYMNMVRNANTDTEETLHGIVTVGHYSRFYVLDAGETELRDRADSGGNHFHFKDNEEQIDAVLCAIVKETH